MSTPTILIKNDDGTATLAIANHVRFTLPALPPSVNALYQIIYSERRVELKPEVRRWKTAAKERMPPWSLRSPDSLICIDAVFYYDFYHANGNLRDFDTHNLMKALIDAIAERYGFRDKRVKRAPCDSYHSKQERAIVTVSEYYLSDGELEMKKGD